MKQQGFPFDNASNFDFFLKYYCTCFGKLILFPFEVMLTSFQSNFITSQIKFHFNFTFSGTKVLVILNI